MADSENVQREAREAIFRAVKQLADDSDEFGGVVRSTMLRDAAYAYRLTAGGPQPGSPTVTEK
ncbi:hypothetical protein C5C95_06135 [Rathayibacter sp. AY1B7]|uniref:hypothetical protein n=1 Tax=Rathayibacter sp. AY1B7 TaxID=2080532 RepID=UPI000CE749F9|nr:hypothetical protein [Rathayibacter sp. AY1B7]PPH99719.1 hypothetical protein C5C95_06135 [Rathayibacter sp. AY1B7]